MFSLKKSLVMLSFIFSIPVLAGETPSTLEGTVIVDAAKVKSMMSTGALVVDTRVAAEYAEAHIKGAVNIPYKEKSAKDIKFDAKLDSFDLGKLPSDKNAKIIMYCNAGECWKSYKASTMAIKNGYKSIYWFRGGIPEWKAKGFPIE